MQQDQHSSGMQTPPGARQIIVTSTLSPQLEIISWRPPDEREMPEAPMVLFVHGAGHTAIHWQLLQELLARKGYRSLAVNLRGHGNSEGQDYLLQNTLQDYVDDTRGVIRDQLQERSYILVGHSLGGYVVQLVCQQEQRYPPAGVVLMATVTPKLSAQARPPLWRIFTSLPTFRRVVKTLRENNMKYLHQTPEHVREAFFSPQASDEIVQFCFAHLQSEPLKPTQQMREYPSPETGGLRPTMPMLAMGAGQRDSIAPPEKLRATAAAYGADVIIFPAMGHDLMLDAGYEQVADALVQWIERLPSERPAIDAACSLSREQRQE
jgi:alpha-beta hydrolase superfamily lysophospholipase